MLETLPDTVHRENGSTAELAKHKESRMELEVAKLKYALLQKELEALRMSLKRSGRFTWIWFLLSQLLLTILLFILSYLYWYP